MAPNLLHWPEPPSDWPALASALRPEVHVWAAGLDVAAHRLAGLAESISETERERALRFHSEQHRDRFIAGRGFLRQVLAGYLNLEPAALEFAYGSNGKPELIVKSGSDSHSNVWCPPFRVSADPNTLKGGHQTGQSGLHFNLAHSEDLALLAVTLAGPVGVDVERVRPLADDGELVARFFSPSEAAAFQQLPEEQRPPAFFNLWTRKEAWLKATGEGIASSLHLVEVSFRPGEAARLLSLPCPRGPDAAWELHALAPAPGFVAAVAIAAENVCLHAWKWPGS